MAGNPAILEDLYHYGSRFHEHDIDQGLDHGQPPRCVSAAVYELCDAVHVKNLWSNQDFEMKQCTLYDSYLVQQKPITEPINYNYDRPGGIKPS